MQKIGLLLMFGLPLYVTAGGFQLNTQGQHAMSMGGAYTAIGKDASTVFYNPGAMCFAKKSTITFGGTFIKTKTSYLSAYNGNVEAENPALIPFHAYLNYVLTDKISLGLAINNPFRSDFKWADNWEGRYLVQEMKWSTYYIQPSASYRIRENFGVGGGVVYALGKLNLNRAVPVEGSAPYGGEELKINGNGLGFNLGFFYKFDEEGTVAVNYRSAVKFSMKDGEAAFSDIPASFAGVYPSSAKFETDLQMPSVISTGFSYKFTDELITTLQLDLATWSCFDSLNFVFPENPSLDIRTGRLSKNAVSGRVGGQYSFTENLDVRIGAAYELASVPEDHLSPDLPEADKVVLTTGAGYKFNKMLSGDITVGLENYFERKGSFTDANLSGSYKSTSMIIGIGLNYEF
ncbi:MAG: outer membrane protein transport protein [Bacteroidia bacterium]